MFEHERVKDADEYIVQVTSAVDVSFEHPLFSYTDSSLATMISHFEFGKKYSWRYTGLRHGKQLQWIGPFDFEILDDIHVHKKSYRADILLNDPAKNSGGLITLDMAHTIIDRDGNFIWFLPLDTGENIKKELRSMHNRTINDISVTKSGTVTLINSARGEERALNGKFIWISPKQIPTGKDSVFNRSSYNYHHCFRKLSSGNYMILDKEIISKPATMFGAIHPLYRHVPGADSSIILIANEMIKEFDKKGNMVWKWSSENYFDNNELKNVLRKKPDSGLLNSVPGGHLNAFEVDEKNGFVYAGFRAVSRVIKIDKDSGNVVLSWGQRGERFFSKQHDITLLHDGTLAVFNNDADSIDTHQASSVIIFTQPSVNERSQTVWKFDCRLDTGYCNSFRGGSVDELKNGNLLVCMGAINRVFEVTRNKEIVWSSTIERYDEHELSWRPLPLERAHYTSSLYPCYFTIVTNHDTLTKTTPTFELRIFNDGTEDDSYQIVISSSSGAYNKQFDSNKIQSRRSQRIKIKLSNIHLKGEKVTISVRSNTNPDLIRSITVPYLDL